ncbi:MAG: PIN domain-containing protein [Chitinivibrionales bacterium]|nr:PIN domain-containing protein [Chitinivibrionales bacterium]
MEKKKIYLESSVISYYANRRSRNLIVAAYQEITQEWWENELPKHDAFISQFVIDEIERGDTNQAENRMKAIADFPLVELTEQVLELAERYLSQLSIPRKSRIDAFHIAAAVVNGMDFIVSWNFHHIANVFVKEKIRKINDSLGVFTSEICTPEELVDEKENQYE